ncbi:MAG: LysR substrate-binding domain-containing protein [Vibrio sp.]
MLKSHQAASLYTFMQVAQYPSFSLAATALHLTTGAISQQILQLEAQLGFSLFERHSRGVRLTEAGEQLLNTVQRSYQDIEQTLRGLKLSSERKEIRLKLTPSFAFKWLVPRLEDFYRRHPEIQIQTFAEGALVDSDRRDYDLAIDYGMLPYPRKDAQLLMEEFLLPVMSKAYLAAHPWLQQDWAYSAAWPQVVLLHDAMPWANAARDQEWHYWAKQMGVVLPKRRDHYFNRTDMAMSAAEAGVGIALARIALLSNELDSGRLVTPFAPIPAQAGYFLITHQASDATQVFTDWLDQQILR